MFQKQYLFYLEYHRLRHEQFAPPALQGPLALVRRPPAHVLLVRSESLLGSRLPQILYLPTGNNRFTIKLAANVLLSTLKS
jgi:hypothetical protein